MHAYKLLIESNKFVCNWFSCISLKILAFFLFFTQFVLPAPTVLNEQYSHYPHWHESNKLQPQNCINHDQNYQFQCQNQWAKQKKTVNEFWVDSKLETRKIKSNELWELFRFSIYCPFYSFFNLFSQCAECEKQKFAKPTFLREKSNELLNNF